MTPAGCRREERHHREGATQRWAATGRAARRGTISTLSLARAISQSLGVITGILKHRLEFAVGANSRFLEALVDGIHIVGAEVLRIVLAQDVRDLFLGLFGHRLGWRRSTGATGRLSAHTLDHRDSPLNAVAQ